MSPLSIFSALLRVDFLQYFGHLRDLFELKKSLKAHFSQSYSSSEKSTHVNARNTLEFRKISKLKSNNHIHRGAHCTVSEKVSMRTACRCRHSLSD
jgi:hypothetical protein